MSPGIILVEETSVAEAWKNAYIFLKESGDKALRPMCVSIFDIENEIPVERSEIMYKIDDLLSTSDKCFKTRITAQTIFPYTHWSNHKLTRWELFDWYKHEYLPRYKATTKRKKKETYFERLINYKPKNCNTPVNQLEEILLNWEHYKGMSRSPARSKLQASCFDPTRDLNKEPYMEFPCLQQVGFSFSDKGELSVNGYYTIQYIVERAYGNYLGLLYLGLFMAHEMHLKLSKINIFVASPRKTMTFKREDLKSLEDTITSEFEYMPAG